MSHCLCLLFPFSMLYNGFTTSTLSLFARIKAISLLGIWVVVEFGPNLQIFAESFDTFKQELLLRSSLETQKLELMTEISSLRLKHASLERENIELKDRVVGKSTGDLSFIDSSSNAGLGGGGSSRIWDKPPIGPERAASPAHSISVDPSVSRSRLASGTSEHQHAPPQRTRVSSIFSFEL